MTRKLWAAMSAAQRREKVALLCGWERTPEGLVLFEDGHYKRGPEDLPHYLTDLNAMHEAEARAFIRQDGRMSAEEKWYYCMLYELTDYDSAVCRASASVRAEAFAIAVDPE